MRPHSNYNNFVSVVIISYDPTAITLQKTLNVLLRQSYTHFEIIVVDSGVEKHSTSVMQKALAGSSIPHLALEMKQKKDERFNYAHAYNVGIRKAKGDIVVRLSGDAVPVGKHWLTHCVTLLQNDHVGIISGSDIVKNQLSLDTYLLSAIYDRARFIAIQTTKRKVLKKMPLTNGPCMIFWRSIWKKHKFNEEWLWGEEFEFTTWAMRKGYYLIYDPKIRILHSHRLATTKALQRIGADLLFIFKTNKIFQEQILLLIQEQLKTTIEVPFAQIEKGRQYYIKNGSSKIVQSYVRRLSSLKRMIDQILS